MTRPFLHQAVELVGVLQSAGLSVESLVSRPWRVPDDPAESLPFSIRGHRDRAPPVISQTAVHAVRRCLRMAVAHAVLLSPVNRVVQNGGLQAVDRGLQLGELYVLTLAGASAVVESADNRHRRYVRDKEIRIRPVCTGGISVRPAGQVVDTGERLLYVSECAVVGIGPAPPLRPHADHDDIRPDLYQVVICQAKPLHRTRGEALDDHVSSGDESAGDLDCPG